MAQHTSGYEVTLGLVIVIVVDVMDFVFGVTKTTKLAREVVALKHNLSSILIDNVRGWRIGCITPEGSPLNG
jgi:hypothetical protein